MLATERDTQHETTTSLPTVKSHQVAHLVAVDEQRRRAMRIGDPELRRLMMKWWLYGREPGNKLGSVFLRLYTYIYERIVIVKNNKSLDCDESSDVCILVHMYYTMIQLVQ